MKHLKTMKNIYITLSICLIVGGIILLIFPVVGLDVLCKICGIFLVAYGIAKVSGYFTKDLFQLAFQFDFGLGIVSTILGLVMLFRTKEVVEFFAICVGIFMMIDAGLKIQTSIEARRFGISRWPYILTVAIITGVIGAILLFVPFEATKVIVRVVGLGICADGVMNLIVVFNTVRTIKNSTTEKIDIDEYDIH